MPNSGAWAYLALSLLKTKGFASEPAERLAPRLQPPLILVRRHEEDLEDLADALRAWGLADEPAYFGADEQVRLASQEKLYHGAPVVLTLEESLRGPGRSAQEYGKTRLALRPGLNLKRQDLISRLTALGYRRADFAESPGEYAVRGAIVDFFPLEPMRAVRVLYVDDRIDSLRVYDAQTQATEPEMLAAAAAAPIVEKSAARTLGEALAGGGLWLAEEGVELPAGAGQVVRVGIAAGAKDEELDFGARPVFPPGTEGLRIDAAAKLCGDRIRRGFRIMLFSMNRGEDERIQELLEERLPAGAVQFRIGPLRQGFEIPGRRLTALSAAEIFGRSYRTRRVLKPAISQRARVRWGELKKGDFVVHEFFGIARYRGLEGVMALDDPVDAPESFRREDGTRRLGTREPERRRPHKVMDCLKLEFRSNDALFVPMTEFKSVQKYIAAEGHRPRLSSLDTRSWKEVKARVQEGVRELAEQLLKVQAARKAVRGHAFAADTHMEQEFARSFPFEETPDQRQAIEDVKADMTAPHPMDRVIVGDVGFGKTEVAMRATLKCVAGMRQTAVLVPTTILADQHARTFRKRLAEYPVRIEMLSRFQTRKQQQAVLREAAEGKIDILIGTHRLLQKDVRFRQLGLIIIDEEHRFGVRAKEQMKQLRKTVDCLMLSATPIPRTLHQCLSGLRKVSLIQSAPSGRQPIQTTVEPWSEQRVVESVQDELARGGQVYYVHNRVRSLPQTQERLEQLLPGVRICMAHGQMRADALERTMWDFFNGKYDMLLASSIIESGLDIPSVNTLLIENAQDFGLSQLYQLRGRIGRERRRAFCHLLYPADKKAYQSLSEDARKRLEAMRDFADLGSGFMLAMRDLEIRGAGDLLGAKQHGFLNAVGVEFYSELLNEEIRKLQGAPQEAAAPPPAHLDLTLPAFIPEEYLPGDLERIQFYKRILAAPPDEVEKLKRELVDLSGPMPEPVENLFHVLRVRTAAAATNIRTVVQRGSQIEIYFRKEAAVPVDNITRWMCAYKDRIEFISSEEGDGLRVIVSDRAPIDWLGDFIQGLGRK